MAQPFLKTGQDGFIVCRLDIDDAVGRQPHLGDGRGKQILPYHAPQNLALGPGRDARREQSRGGAINRAIAAAGHFMQRAHCQTAAWKTQIYLRQPERQNFGRAAVSRLDSPDFLTQTLNDGRWEHKTAFR